MKNNILFNFPKPILMALKEQLFINIIKLYSSQEL